MEFGWINLVGAGFVIAMMIPNIIYGLKGQPQENKCKSKVLNITEQIGRYGSIVLMWLPLFVWKFGFRSVAEMLAYIIISAVLLLMYFVIWLFYFKKPVMKFAIPLAVIPTAIFLIDGILLRHWLLVLTAVLFGIGHISVTVKNH